VILTVLNLNRTIRICVYRLGTLSLKLKSFIKIRRLSNGLWLVVHTYLFNERVCKKTSFSVRLV